MATSGTTPRQAGWIQIGSGLGWAGLGSYSRRAEVARLVALSWTLRMGWIICLSLVIRRNFYFVGGIDVRRFCFLVLCVVAVASEKYVQ